MADDVGPTSGREWVLWVGFAFVVAAGIATVLWPELRNDADPEPEAQPASGAAREPEGP